MNFEPEHLQDGLFARISHVICSRDVQQGVGAVLVLIGIALMISGVIFTVVAYTGSKSESVSSFPYVGPVLIALAVICVINGYVMNHFDDFKLLWYYFKRRKGENYLDQGETDSNSAEELYGSFSAICVRLLVCMIFRRYRRNFSDVSVDDAENMQDQPAEQTTGTDTGLNNSSMTISFSSLRQCKVHPEMTDSEV